MFSTTNSQSRILIWIVLAALILVFLAFFSPLAEAQVSEPSPGVGVHLVRSGQNGIEIMAVGPDYVVQSQHLDGHECQQVHLPDHQVTEQQDEPSIPVRVILLSVPPKADISLQAASRQSQKIPQVTRACMANGVERVSREETYSKGNGSGTNQQMVRIQDMGFMRSQRLLRLEIYPVQVNALTGEALYHQQIDISIQFQGDVSGEFVAEPAAFETMFRQNILNYATSKEWRTTQTEPPQLGAWTPPQPAYKISVNESGLYVLTKDEMRDAGLPVDSLDPRTLKMYFMGEELAILVTGEQDTSLDDSDAVLFFGEGVNTRYTDTGIYWLSHDGELGKRIHEQSSTSGGSLDEAYISSVHSEDNVFYMPALPKEPDFDHWYGYRINALPPAPLSGHRDYDVHLEHVASGNYQASVETAIGGNFDGVHHLRLYINGDEVLDDTWSGRTMYRGDTQFSQGLLQEGKNTVRVEMVNDTPGQLFDFVNVDWLQLSYWRKYSTDDDLLVFGGDLSGSIRYQIDGFTSPDIQVFDITDPNQVKQITGTSISDQGGAKYRLQFGTNETNQRKYLALTTAQRRTPTDISADTPSNLQSTSNSADYIILSHHDFLDAIQPLVTQRTDQGMRVTLVDVQDVYDEFGYGMMSAEAIRDFLAYTYRYWQSPAPSDVLLVGDGTYDLRQYLGTSAPTFLPPFLEMVDFDLGETATDNRYVAVSGDDILPDMNIGRLPANTSNQAEVMVDKILRYESLSPGEAWTKNVLFVTDNLEGGGGNFYELSDAIADGYADPPTNTAKLLPEEYTRTKIYQGMTCPSQNPSVDCRQEISDSINAGTLMVSYIGHGSKTFWASEHLYDIDAVKESTNVDKMPIMLPMTCIEGYFADPGIGDESTSEAGLRFPDGGAVASWAPTGYGLSTGHDYLERGFFLSVFHEGEERIGASTTAAKLYLIANSPPGKYLDMIDTFLLLGDPALRLPVSVQEPERTLFLPLTAKEQRK